MDWLANSIHFVLFTVPKPGVSDAIQPWQRLFGVPPEQYQQHPQGAQFGGTAMGTVGDYQMHVIVSPQRLELAIMPKQNPSISNINGEISPPSLTDLDSAFGAFTQYALKMLIEEGVYRLAVLLNLSLPTTSATSAAAKFYEFSRIKGLPDQASDLSLTVNVPRKVENISMEINRVCRWATGIGQMVQVNFTGTMALPTVHQTHAALLNIDVNTAVRQTAATPNVLKSGDRERILVELVSEAKQIMWSGYDRLASIN